MNGATLLAVGQVPHPELVVLSRRTTATATPLDLPMKATARTSLLVAFERTPDLLAEGQVAGIIRVSPARMAMETALTATRGTGPSIGIAGRHADVATTPASQHTHRRPPHRGSAGAARRARRRCPPDRSPGRGPNRLSALGQVVADRVQSGRLALQREVDPLQDLLGDPLVFFAHQLPRGDAGNRRIGTWRHPFPDARPARPADGERPPPAPRLARGAVRPRRRRRRTRRAVAGSLV